MQNLPPPEVYEQEFRYMPWGITINRVLKILRSRLPRVPGGAIVFDLGCGTGFLGGRLMRCRPDIIYVGLDLKNEYVKYARQKYGDYFFLKDAARLGEKLHGNGCIDAVIATSVLHHLPRQKQDRFMGRTAQVLGENGFAVFADPCISHFTDERSRRLGAARLGYEYLAYTIKKGAPREIVDAAVGVLRNDLFCVEWKTSVRKALPMFKRHFKRVEVIKTWPQRKTDWGDYIFAVSN